MVSVLDTSDATFLFPDVLNTAGKVQATGSSIVVPGKEQSRKWLLIPIYLT